eukprot:c18055_g1_i2.p1 GENE.c18055_g1_i2~~c18055_g1_i2.p1  ORF type:complete len:255 (-),score=31.03 c18055_g1_i2:104-868(-)
MCCFTLLTPICRDLKKECAELRARVEELESELASLRRQRSESEQSEVSRVKDQLQSVMEVAQSREEEFLTQVRVNGYLVQQLELSLANLKEHVFYLKSENSRLQSEVQNLQAKAAPATKPSAFREPTTKQPHASPQHNNSVLSISPISQASTPPMDRPSRKHQQSNKIPTPPPLPQQQTTKRSAHNQNYAPMPMPYTPRPMAPVDYYSHPGFAQAHARAQSFVSADRRGRVPAYGRSVSGHPRPQGRGVQNFIR